MALPLPDQLRVELAPHLAECAAAAPQFAWIPAQNLHLTLRFLGALDGERLQALGPELAQVRAEPLQVRLGARGAFGGRRRARVVWLGLAEGVERCRELAAQVEDACRRAAMPPDDRLFRAHVTLARARGRGGLPLPDLPEPPALPPWTADRFVLFESLLGRPATVYQPVSEFPLTG